MSKKEKSIELLNKAVSDELLAVNQYMYFHFRCDDYGYDLLSNLFKRTAIHEMLHVERLAERILFLKGEVEMTPSGSVEKIHCVKEMLKKAAEMETGSVDDYNNWANECGGERRFGDQENVRSPGRRGRGAPRPVRNGDR